MATENRSTESRLSSPPGAVKRDSFFLSLFFMSQESALATYVADWAFPPVIRDLSRSVTVPGSASGRDPLARRRLP
jgi:hypothetical protein